MYSRTKKPEKMKEMNSTLAKSVSLYFSLQFKILDIWFTITLSGPGLSYGFCVCFLVYGFEILTFC